jgi:hypothetical protein
MRKPHKIVKNEFRFNNSTGHPNYIFEESNGRYRGVGITHEPTTFNKKNMPLHKNPQKGKTDKSYIRNGIISDKKNNYSRVKNNFEFCKIDFRNVKSKIRNYKKKQ